mmetsp:Transcript_1531/g.3797  ORF Transcript_1531/g.3797 Transcript_1531/m.3797 type:complete len:524 (+) Transcript_1531:91-1662(+)
MVEEGCIAAAGDATSMANRLTLLSNTAVLSKGGGDTHDNDNRTDSHNNGSNNNGHHHTPSKREEQELRDATSIIRQPVADPPPHMHAATSHEISPVPIQRTVTSPSSEEMAAAGHHDLPQFPEPTPVDTSASTAAPAAQPEDHKHHHHPFQREDQSSTPPQNVHSGHGYVHAPRARHSPTNGFSSYAMRPVDLSLRPLPYTAPYHPGSGGNSNNGTGRALHAPNQLGGGGLQHHHHQRQHYGGNGYSSYNYHHSGHYQMPHHQNHQHHQHGQASNRQPYGYSNSKDGAAPASHRPSYSGSYVDGQIHQPPAHNSERAGAPAPGSGSAPVAAGAGTAGTSNDAMSISTSSTGARSNAANYGYAHIQPSTSHDEQQHQQQPHQQPSDNNYSSSYESAVMKENARLREDAKMKDQLIVQLQQKLGRMEQQIAELRQLPTGKISHIPIADMLRIMEEYGSEVSNQTMPRRKNEIKKESVIRQFRRWNPEFFRYFTHINGEWVPKLGREGELRRRAEKRKVIKQQLKR